MTIHQAEQISTALAHVERATVSHLHAPRFSPLMHRTTREAPVHRDLDVGGGTPEAAPPA